MEISSIRMPTIASIDGASSTGGAKRANASSEGTSFATLIQQSLAQVNSTQAAAESMTHQYQLNPESVSLEDAMLSLQKANISFQTTVQVRNKLVAAYNDIMNMQL